MLPDDPQDSPSLAALSAIGRDAPAPHTAAELDRGLRALRARLVLRSRGRRALFYWSLIGAAAAACVLAAVKVGSSSRRYAQVPEPGVAVARVEGGNILEGGYLSGRAGIKVLFNEGSTFDLSPGTRGRVRSVANDEVHLGVEHGTASLQITRSRARRWLIEAGPFVVTVKGTSFTVSWDPESERFDLRLREGHVLVSGPTVGKAMALSTGERLAVNLPKAETVITEDSPDDPGNPPEVIAGPVVGGPRAPVSKPAARPLASSEPASKVARPRRWAAELANGRWDNILADADRDGIDATLAGAASEDLFALADAARYRRRIDLSRAALLAHRRRFPASARSLDAVFLLGRVEELRDQGTERAIAWYDQYLAQAPAGSYAAEALGRKMILTDEARGQAAARPIADAYLRRFPNGSYAGSARALLRIP
jgi:hypothetical protein